MSSNLSALALLPKNAYFLLVGANLPPRLIPILLLLIQPLDFIFNKILPSLNIMMTAYFLFLPKAAHLFTYLLLKPFSSKLLTPFAADKKNSCTAQRLYTNDAFSLVLFQLITARLFPINSRLFSCALHSDDSSCKVSDEKLRRYEHFNQNNKLQSHRSINYRSSQFANIFRSQLH